MKTSILLYHYVPGGFLSSLKRSITFSKIKFLGNPSTPRGSNEIFRRHVGHFTSGSK